MARALSKKINSLPRKPEKNTVYEHTPEFQIHTNNNGSRYFDLVGGSSRFFNLCFDLGRIIKKKQIVVP